MSKSIEVSASILSADFANLERDIRRSQVAGADRFHIDCMDGHFVPNMTIGPIIVAAIRPHTDLPLEAHLMIENPGAYIEHYAKAGADIIQIQAECYGPRKSQCGAFGQWPKEVERVDAQALCQDLKKIRQLGKKAYMVVNPATPLVNEALAYCDGVLIMSVNPGFAGQKFMPEVLDKVRELSAGFKGDIAIDGGINAQTAPEAVKAGAHVLITASYLYGAADLKVPVNFLKSLQN